MPLFSIYKDHFGYINVTPNFEPDPGNFYIYSSFVSIIKNEGYPNKELFSTVVRQGVISSISYPTGGFTSYEFEPNYCLHNSQSIKTGGIKVKSTTNYDGIKTTNKVEYVYDLENGQSSGWGYEPQQYLKTSLVRAYKTREGRTPAEYFAQAAFSFGINYLNATAGVTSSAIRNKAFSANIAKEVIALAVALIISELAYIFAADETEFTVYEYSNLSITSNNPLPNQYSRVALINKDQNNQEAGRTVYKFTDPSFRALEIQELKEPYSEKQRFAYWAYGLPKSIDVYKKGDTTPIKRTEYDYNLYVSYLNNYNFLSRKWEVKRRLYYYFKSTPNSTTTDIVQETYYPLVGRAELKQTIEYTYLSGSSVPSTSSTTDYIYSPDNYQIKQSSTRNSKNELIETKIYYPSDYRNVSLLQTLIERNIVSVPVSTQTFIEKNSSKYLINGNVNEYGSLPNGDVGVIRKFDFRSNLPVPENQVVFNDAQLIPNIDFYKESVSTLYGDGLPAQVTTNGKSKAAFIYDYDNKAVVAKVSGAEINDVAYSSFEEGSGNWLITSAVRNTSMAVTGDKSYDIGKGSITKSGLDPARVYICTFWATANSSVTVSGSQNTRQSSSYNGWTLWSYTVTGVNTVTLNGTGTIDELRLYPEGAQMSTKTYRPLVGVTSECDANNKIMYYLHDESGRLMFVRDQDRNILKRYCYKNTEEPESCTVYGNSPKSQNFNPTITCASGSTGLPVAYTVSADTYYSYTQAGADAQAQSDIDRYGQVNAYLNGTCVPAYYNEDKSGNYYSQNCGSQPGVAVYVSIPYGSYVSTISVDDANNQALQYAQNYADQYGTCVSGVSITFSDNTYTYGYVVQLTNESTALSYLFYPEPGYSSLGNVPEGNYSVYIYNQYGYPNDRTFELCDNYDSGYSGSFSSVPISSSGCSNIIINY